MMDSKIYSLLSALFLMLLGLILVIGLVVSRLKRKPSSTDYAKAFDLAFLGV